MEDSLNISSSVDLSGMVSDIVSVITPEGIDCIYTEARIENKCRNNILNLKAKIRLPYSKLINPICDWIINNYETKLMYEIMEECFSEFLQADKEEIVNFAKKKISKVDRFYNKTLIRKKLSEYLNFENVLHMDGFVRFRLREYKEELELLLYEATEEFIAEKEYEAFIELLGEYIETQTPIVDLLHIKADMDGGFSFYDFAKNNISISCENKLESEMYGTTFNEEDKLISILLVLTPKRIIWHNSQSVCNQNLINTIQRVFGTRFSICPGCELC